MTYRPGDIQGLLPGHQCPVRDQQSTHKWVQEKCKISKLHLSVYKHKITEDKDLRLHVALKHSLTEYIRYETMAVPRTQAQQ